MRPPSSAREASQHEYAAFLGLCGRLSAASHQYQPSRPARSSSRGGADCWFWLPCLAHSSGIQSYLRRTHPPLAGLLPI
jgi:hypothetical protein